MATFLNISKFILQLDVVIIVDLIVKNIFANTMLNPLLFECRNLLDKISHKIVVHIFKEANRVCVWIYGRGRQTGF